MYLAEGFAKIPNNVSVKTLCDIDANLLIAVRKSKITECARNGKKTSAGFRGQGNRRHVTPIHWHALATIWASGG
jgi:hypothetical protein